MVPDKRWRSLGFLAYLAMIILGGVASIPLFHDVEIQLRAHAAKAEESLDQ